MIGLEMRASRNSVLQTVTWVELSDVARDLHVRVWLRPELGSRILRSKG